MSKCQVIDNDVKPCKWLSLVTEPSQTHKGISFLQFLNFNTGEMRSVYQIKSGERSKKGLVLNFCPFCGADISSHFKTKEEG